MKISIIIINYNYAGFLKDSINSALSQDYINKEVIVVDDGSTDNSREIIEEFGDSLHAIFQENKGMMEAANAGFAVSKGDIIIFLDADDYLLEGALNRIIENWEPGISKLHFRLRVVDANGTPLSTFPPEKHKLSSGEVWKEIIENGFYFTPPTSGNAFSREALSNLFPIKDAVIGSTGSYFDRVPTDAYLKLKIPFFGEVKAIQDCLAVYRKHGLNSGAGKTPYNTQKKRLRILYLARNDSTFISEKLNKMGLNWSDKVLYRRTKLLFLRVISFRLDEKAYYWNNDTRISLLTFCSEVLFTSPVKKPIKKFFDLAAIFIVLVLPVNFVPYFIKNIKEQQTN